MPIAFSELFKEFQEDVIGFDQIFQVSQQVLIFFVVEEQNETHLAVFRHIKDVAFRAPHELRMDSEPLSVINNSW